ncbi:MAG: endo-1,4-beta-xylanase [Bacteroidota bacterium]
MSKFHVKLLCMFFLILPAVSIAQHIDTTKGLKDYYKKYFPIGVSVSPASLNNSAEATLISKQFNSITPENAMKMGAIHPEQNRYNWRGADEIVNFAQDHHLRVRGHNLCWHENTPKWLFYDKDGKVVSKDTLLQRLKDHIYTVVKRYKGKVYAWDVVNEAVSDKSDEFLRNSLWYQICGEDFIFKAFQYAHEADPDAILFYNDYGTERPAKREKVYQLLKKLVDAHIPVGAVGLQAHWSINDPTEKELIESIERFSSLGIKIQITELDMSVYPSERTPVDDNGYTPAIAEKQSQQYEMVFKIFRKYKDVITGVTFWNISDRSSWLNNFPIKGRKNYPLLFDDNLHPKPAYWRVIAIK